MNSINHEMLTRYREEYDNNAFAQAMTAAAAKSDLEQIAYVRKAADKLNGDFAIEIKTHGITSQDSSGRCWMYAGMNMIRERVFETCGMDSFELSGNYLEFYDKLEKANNVLEMAIAYAKDPLNTEMNIHILGGIGDGGDWDMFKELVKKYGVVPKTAMDESYISGHTATFLKQLNRLVRKDIMELRRMVAAGQDTIARKEEMLGEIYRVLCIVFGQPVDTFEFSWRDQDKEYHVDFNLTPQEFYQKYIGLDLDSYVAVTNMPYANTPLGVYYEYHYRGNMTGKNITMLNLTNEEMKELTLKQLRDGQTVLFSCNSRMYGERALGIWDPDSWNFGGVLGGIDLSMSVEDELNSKESFSTHCMLFCGVNFDENGKPNRWKIENSWGKQNGRDGYYVCSDKYYDQYVYQGIVQKKYLSEAQLEILSKEPVIIQPWEIDT